MSNNALRIIESHLVASYKFNNGWTMERGGNRGFWILRDERGNTIDMDRYRNDLAQRHNLVFNKH